MAWGAEAVARTPQSITTRRTRRVDWWLVWAGVHMSLAFKLAVPAIVTTAVLAAVMGSFVINQVTAQIAQAYDREAESVAAGVEAMVTQHPNDVSQMNDYLRRIVKSRPDLVAVRIHSLDANVTVYASSDAEEVGARDLVDAEEKQAIW